MEHIRQNKQEEESMNKKNDAKTTAAVKNGGIPLDDEKLEQANGGMKLFIFEKPKLIETILKMIFKVKKK